MSNAKRMLFITEILSRPFDEGMKNVALFLHNNLKEKMHLLTITRHDNDVGGLDVERSRLDKFFLSSELRQLINDYNPEVILYMPETSITFNSFLRGRILKSITRDTRIALFATIRRNYTIPQRLIIQRFLRPDLVFLFGGFKDWVFSNIRTCILPPAIDIKRFSIPLEEEKLSLRKKYGIHHDKRVLLHVGHVRPTRNVSLLAKVQRLENVQVLIIDSTTTPQYKELIKRLKGEGIMIISEYIPDISEIYRLSDVYVFPVKDEIASINLPLSILEAMACGLPVITTRFGGLEGYFQEDEGFRFFDNDDKFVRLISNSRMDGRNNRGKVERFTWNGLVGDMIKWMFAKP